MIMPVIDADELCHSKGPWLTHKYIRREGKEPPYKYFYGEKTSTGKQVGEEREVYLHDTRKNIYGGINKHYEDANTPDFRTGEYFYDDQRRRIAKVNPNSEYGLEFYDNPKIPFGELSVIDAIKQAREYGGIFLHQMMKKLEPTYNYTNKAKGVDFLSEYGLTEYSSIPRRKRKPR